MKLSNFLMIFISIFKLAHPNASEVEQLLSKLKKTTYQDVIINGKMVKEGVKDCEIRYKNIQSIAQKYNRPFTVLDIGASEGYFSLRIATEFPQSCCVMIEGDKTVLLPEICKLNTSLSNTVVLQKFITPEDLKKLGECEHFDLVLAFNVIHQLKGAWKETIDAILSLGDNILIETPPPGCHTSANAEILPLVEEYLGKSAQAKIIDKVPRYGRPGLATPEQKYSNVYHFAMNKNVLLKPTWNSPNIRFYPLNSNFEQKTIYKARINKTINWIKGINLWTFKHMNGVYPEKGDIVSEIKRLSMFTHYDFLPWNIIIQGKNLELIDWDDYNAPEYTNNYAACIAQFESRQSKTTENI